MGKDTRFKEGHPGGPGRPRKIPETQQLKELISEVMELKRQCHDAKVVLDEEKKNLKPPQLLPSYEFNRKKFLESVNKFLFMPHTALKDVVHTQASVLDMTIAMVLYNAMTKGDVVRMEWICQRTLGKVTEKVEVTLPQATIIERIGGGEVELGAVLKEPE